MSTIIYTRVSTNDQAQEGISLSMQADRCEAYARAHDLSEARVIEDAGFSASSLSRPGMQSLLALVAAGAVSDIVIFKLDRLSRSIMDFGALVTMLDKSNVKLHSVMDHIDTGSATGRFFTNIMMTVAQWEREVTGERVSQNLQFVKSQGFHLGAAPFGYSLLRNPAKNGKGSVLVMDPEKQVVATEIRRLRALGFGLATIAGMVNDSLRTDFGWGMQIKRVLDAPTVDDLVPCEGGYRHRIPADDL